MAAESRNHEQDMKPVLLVLNQMAGPMTWELVEDLAQHLGDISLLTGHPDTLAKGSQAGVTLVPSVAYKRGSLVVRGWRWLRYAVHAFFWLLRQPRETPILVFSNPPIGLWCVRLVHLLRGTPYAVMVHDIFPEVLVRKGVAGESHFLVRMWHRINRWAYESASVVMTLGKYMASTLDENMAASKTAAGEIVIVPPWSDDQKIQPIRKQENWFAKEHDQVGKLTCMYSGNMGLGHDLESMYEAAEQLKSDPDIRFMFIGAGPKWDLTAEYCKKHDLTNTKVLGWQPEDVIPSSLATADLALVSLEQELSGLAVPSKAFYFLAANVPLIAVCDEATELAEVVQKYGCGAVVPPGNPDQIVEAIQSVDYDKGLLLQWKAGAQAAMQEFRRNTSTRRFAELLCTHLGISMGGSIKGESVEEQR